jgi:hypothetical protein
MKDLRFTAIVDALAACVASSRRYRMAGRWLVFMALLAPLIATSPARAARPEEGAGVISIVDGDASVLDGRAHLRAVRGLRVLPDTIVQTGPKAVLLRIELPQGGSAELGPDTRVLFRPQAFDARLGIPVLYLLQGWVKIVLDGTDARALRAHDFELRSLHGALVAHAGVQGFQLFLESGAAEFVERHAGIGGQSTKWSDGVFYASNGAGAPFQATAPSADMLATMPPAYRDTLRRGDPAPPVLTPVDLPAPSRAELQQWLASEPVLRRDLARRFPNLARARDLPKASAASGGEVRTMRRASKPPSAAWVPPGTKASDWKTL